MELLKLENIYYKVEENSIINDISLSVDKGDFISIIGSSGSGKSTFLKLISNLISPTKGNIYYKGKKFDDYNPTDLRKEIGYIFQNPYLFGDNVKENLKYPYQIRNLSLDMDRVEELFSLFQMECGYINRDVKNLSGGEQQRIALIRSLLFMPEVLLLDEITSALDEENKKIVEEVIFSLNEQGKTILWVTHDLKQSRKYSKKILEIHKGEVASLEVLR